MLDNFKFYIEFVTDYELDVSNKTFISNGEKPINKMKFLRF